MSNTVVIPWQSFVLELTTIGAHIKIPEKNKTYQTEDATRNVFTNIIFRVIITGLLTIIDHAKMKKNFKADIHIYNGIIN